MSISERLKKELKARTPAMTTRQLQKEVEKEAGKGTRGTSYASVYEYVEGKGKAEPPLSFLRPAAEVLGIRLEFLISGEGPQTEEEHLVDAQGATLGEAGGLIMEAGGSAAWMMFTPLLLRLIASCPDAKEAGTKKAIGPIAYHLQRVALHTYRALNPSGFDDEVRRSDHFEAMIHAMALAVPDRGQGVPIKKLLKNLEGRKS